MKKATFRDAETIRKARAARRAATKKAAESQLGQARKQVTVRTAEPDQHEFRFTWDVTRPSNQLCRLRIIHRAEVIDPADVPARFRFLLYAPRLMELMLVVIDSGVLHLTIEQGRTER